MWSPINEGMQSPGRYRAASVVLSIFILTQGQERKPDAKSKWCDSSVVTGTAGNMRSIPPTCHQYKEPFRGWVQLLLFLHWRLCSCSQR